MINLLKERGKLIGDDLDKADVVEKNQQIHEIVRENDNVQELTKPICAFVTFTNQEAKERCMEYLIERTKEGKINDNYKEGGLTSLGHTLEVEDAPEPSDIIWENL